MNEAMGKCLGLLNLYCPVVAIAYTVRYHYTQVIFIILHVQMYITVFPRLEFIVLHVQCILPD